LPSGPINRINLSQGGATLSRDQHRHGQRDLHIENQFRISIEQGQVFVVGCPMMWGTRDGIVMFYGLDSRAGHSAHSQSRPVFEMIGALYYFLLHLFPPLHPFPLFIFRISSSHQPSFTCSSASYLSLSLFSSHVSVYFSC
jgi:hypothetical protein